MKITNILLPLALFSMGSSALDLKTPTQHDTSNLVWTGHISPDTDTVTSAILAAHIYGGTAVVPEALNPESQFVMQYCKMKAPLVLNDYANKQVGIVDFNQKTQLQKSIDTNNIVAIVDHHAIGGQPLNLSQIVSMDIRPWGSAATILADRAESLNIEISKEMACTTLAGILSDTVILESPTTTQYDRDLATKLAKQAGISDLQDFGKKMLIAKSDLSHLDATKILTMDYKNFEFSGKKVGIGVAETLTAEQLLLRKDEFTRAMKDYKKEHQLDHLFFSVTDTKNKQANLLWIDENDAIIVQHAFNSKSDTGWLTLPGVTSRKGQIGPAIQSAIEALN